MNLKTTLFFQEQIGPKLSGIRSCQNSNLQLNLNLVVVWFDMIMTLSHHLTTRNFAQDLVGHLKTFIDNFRQLRLLLDYPRQYPRLSHRGGKSLTRRKYLQKLGLTENIWENTMILDLFLIKIQV